MKQIQWPGRYCYRNVFIKLFSCFIAAKCTLLLSLMQGLFNAPLQEEKSVVGVVLKGLMWSNLQGVAMFQLPFDVCRPANSNGCMIVPCYSAFSQ